MAAKRPTKQVQRIQEMEELFDASAQAVAEFDVALKKFKRAQLKIGKLSAYYGSEQWFADVDAHADGKLPQDLKCGVLGEDLPYDVLVGYHDLAIRMLECATKALKA